MMNTSELLKALNDQVEGLREDHDQRIVRINAKIERLQEFRTQFSKACADMRNYFDAWEKTVGEMIDETITLENSELDLARAGAPVDKPQRMIGNGQTSMASRIRQS